jgi:hypothetical protein
MIEMEAPSTEHSAHLRKAVLYFVLGVLFWIIVDFGTAGGFNVGYFGKYGLTLCIFYIGYPAVFTFFIFVLKLREKHLLLATMIGIFVVEVVFTRNPLIMEFPVCLLGVPLAVAVYAPLTFFPLWIVRREMRKHLRWVIFLSSIVILVMILTTFGSGA